MRALKRFLKDEKGLETVEWTILAALIILGIVTVVGSLQDEISGVFTGLANEMITAGGGTPP